MKGYNGGAEWNMASAYWGLGQTSVWAAVWSREMLANDPELLPLLPHMRDLLLAGPAERPRAVLRFRTIARELGFDVEDLVRLGPRLGIRVPREVAVALGESEAVAEGFWSNYPKFWMWSQSLRDFRQSEAFRSRVRDSGMLAYWRSHGWPDLCRAVGAEDFECD